MLFVTSWLYILCNLYLCWVSIILFRGLWLSDIILDIFCLREWNLVLFSELWHILYILCTLFLFFTSTIILIYISQILIIIYLHFRLLKRFLNLMFFCKSFLLPMGSKNLISMRLTIVIFKVLLFMNLNMNILFIMLTYLYFTVFSD